MTGALHKQYNMNNQRNIILNPCPAEKLTYSIFQSVQSYNSKEGIENMWILIRWLNQKQADLDLQCFQNRIYPASAG